MTVLANLHFIRPLALLLLLALPLFWLAWRHGRSDAGAWRAAVDAHLLPHLMERIDGGPGRAGVVFAALLWALACLALAGPAWEREPMPLYHNQAARVLALELAPSMLAQDEKPSRLARARYKIDDILARSRDLQTALIGYAGEAFVAAPLTDDVGTVRNLVDALSPDTMPVAGNATARAIERAADLIVQAGLRNGEIILIADGVAADAAAAARKARERGFSVSVLGVGSASGAPVPLAQGGFQQDGEGNLQVSRLDEAALRAVAAAGGGRYAALTPDARDLDSLLLEHVEGADAPAAATQAASSARWRDRGPWLLLLLVPLALFGFRRGWLMLLACALLTPPTTAQAFSLRDLWLRPDQQAAAALAQGDAKQALDVARAPQWRGSAAYRAGEFETAATDYARLDNAEGHYNRGNALARLGRYQDAIAAYDAALQREPDMADAKANRQTVEEFLKQQQSQSSEQGDSKKSPPSEQSPQDPADGGKPSPGEEGAQDTPQEGASPSDKNSDEVKDSAAKPPSADADPGSDHDAGEQAKQAESEQKEALSKSIDQALQRDTGAEEADGKPAAAVSAEDEAEREKNQALDHLLQRVPDDPGGLLRRKFQLEYQRRQQREGHEG